uniref:Retrotransposon gag domain-containing protein n=1 Tax=Nelumbo nucifera TaxID=4432 RepID=A0A822ZGE2_NELNU|nr:TPA_asm: hypothetical protein HUJ06_002432 [Nelumbo nucifera]
MESAEFKDHIILDSKSGKEKEKSSSWSLQDRLLKSLICGTITEESLSLVVGRITAQEVWECLEGTFAEASKDGELILTHQLHTIRKGKLSVAEYLKIFKIICDELGAIQKPVSEPDKVYWAAHHGLGPSYMVFTTTTILARPPLPSWNQFVSALNSHIFGCKKQQQLTLMMMLLP